MKEHIIEKMAQVMQNNLGNKLTPELANGILFMLGALLDAELPKTEDDA